MPITGRIDKLWYTHIIVYKSSIKINELSILATTCMNQQSQFVVWTNWTQKGAHIKTPSTGGKTINYDRNQSSGCHGSSGVSGWLENGTRELSSLVKIYYILIWIVVTRMHKFVRTYQTVHLRCVLYLIYAPCLNREKKMHLGMANLNSS